MIAGVPAAILLGVAHVPSWLYLVCAVVFALGAWKNIERETHRDVGDGYPNVNRDGLRPSPGQKQSA